MAAQLIHASGESSPGNLASNTYAVCLSARDEQHLLELEQKLIGHEIPHVAIREPDAPWNGALMSIGIVPCDRKFPKRVTSQLPLLK